MLDGPLAPLEAPLPQTKNLQQRQRGRLPLQQQPLAVASPCLLPLPSQLNSTASNSSTNNSSRRALRNACDVQLQVGAEGGAAERTVVGEPQGPPKTGIRQMQGQRRLPPTIRSTNSSSFIKKERQSFLLLQDGSGVPSGMFLS